MESANALVAKMLEKNNANSWPAPLGSKNEMSLLKYPEIKFGIGNINNNGNTVMGIQVLNN